MSLVYKLARHFTRRNIQVVMLEDFPSVGFEGQVVNVKPGFARQTLLPKNQAVYNFPGVRQRLFPDIRQVDIDQKMRYYRDLTNFQAKVDKISLEFIKAPSFANPALLKEEISTKDIIKDVFNKHGIELKMENIPADETIERFGTYSVAVKDFFNTELQKKFNFNLDVQVKQPTIREVREEKDTSKDTSKDSKLSKDLKQIKDLKNQKQVKDPKIVKNPKSSKVKDTKSAAKDGSVSNKGTKKGK